MSVAESPFAVWLTKLFDRIEEKWDSEPFLKLMAIVLVGSYLLAILFIELKSNGIISWSVIPVDHFKAIELAFTFLLFFEVINLVFSLVKSVSVSMETQLQILSLILLRNAFKLFGEFPDTITWHAIQHKVILMSADAFGALIIFFIIIFIRKIDKHRYISKSIDEQQSFINIKKIIAFILLITFIVLIVTDIYYFFNTNADFNFFHKFFTILIFNDILLVFIALRYCSRYRILFRNSGFALATITMRLSLEIKAPYNDLLGVSSAIFVLLLVMAYNRIPNAYQEMPKD